MPDAADYGDAGSNTLLAASKSSYFSMPNMRKLGFFNIDGVDMGKKRKIPLALLPVWKNYPKEQMPPSDIGKLQVLYPKHHCRRIRMDFQKQ